jgi:hypothetical protein
MVLCLKSGLINLGVPQGSILGPVLFLVYINDLSLSLKFSKPFMYADDTSIFHSHRNTQQLVNEMNEDLSLLGDWLRVNRLSLNVPKTKFVVFRHRQSKHPNVNLQINASAIS